MSKSLDNCPRTMKRLEASNKSGQRRKPRKPQTGTARVTRSRITKPAEATGRTGRSKSSVDLVLRGPRPDGQGPSKLERSQVGQGNFDQSKPNIGEEGGGKSLCQMCRDVFDHWYELPPIMTFHKNFDFYNNTSFMKSAARDGCLLCAQFLQILESANVWRDAPLFAGLRVTVKPLSFNGATQWTMKLDGDRSAIPEWQSPEILVSYSINGESRRSAAIC